VPDGFSSPLLAGSLGGPAGGDRWGLAHAGLERGERVAVGIRLHAELGSGLREALQDGGFDAVADPCENVHAKLLIGRGVWGQIVCFQSGIPASSGSPKSRSSAAIGLILRRLMLGPIMLRACRNKPASRSVFQRERSFASRSGRSRWRT
jgi:hypothetical protein